MGADREEPQKALEPGAEAKRKRFRIVKLEERIAPKQPATKGPHRNTHKCPSIVIYSCWCPW